MRPVNKLYLHLIYQIVYRQCAYAVTVQVWQSVYLFLKCCYCKSISFNQKWLCDFKKTWLKLNSFYPTFSRVFMWSIFDWPQYSWNIAHFTFNSNISINKKY